MPERLGRAAPAALASSRGRQLFGLLSDPRVSVSVIILVALLIATIFADVIAPYDPNRQYLRNFLLPPSLTLAGAGEFPHLAGTDHLGRDVLSRVLHGGRISFFIGIVTALIAVVAGSAVGILSGYFAGPAGRILMRFADLQMAFPFLVLAITVIAAVGPSLLAIVVTLAFWGWVSFARLVRAEVIVQMTQDYIVATRVVGASHTRVIFRHIIPNIASSLIVVFTFFVGIVILSEGALSFLGLGVQPPDASWGRMMAEGRSRLASAWWITVAPGLPLSLSVLAVNMLGDSLNDKLNPRLRGREALSSGV